jgi:hypothetical protein
MIVYAVDCSLAQANINLSVFFIVSVNISYPKRIIWSCLRCGDADDFLDFSVVIVAKEGSIFYTLSELYIVKSMHNRRDQKYTNFC